MWTWLEAGLTVAAAAVAFTKGIKKQRPWGKPLLAASLLGLVTIPLGLFYYYLLLALLAGVMFAYVKGVRQHKEWGKATLAACTIALVVLALGRWVVGKPRPSEGEASRKAFAKELDYCEAQMIHLGRHLAQKYPGRYVLVLTQTGSSEFERKRNETMQEALDEGFGGRLTIEARENVALAQSPRQPVAVLEDAHMTVEALDGVLSRHRDCNLVVSTVALPYDYAKTRLSQMPDEERPKVVLVLTASYPGLADLLKTGHVAAAVVAKPFIRHDPDAAVPHDPSAAFGERYLLIDAQNISDMP